MQKKQKKTQKINKTGKKQQTKARRDD